MPENYIQRAKGIVRNYVERTLDKSDPPVQFDVYVVWFCKTLQNWKALVSTTLFDSTYYEVTFNGDKNEAYLDVYRKADNITVGPNGNTLNEKEDGDARSS